MSPQAGSPRYVAFSLGVAQQELKNAGAARSQIRYLGAIRRPVGIVYDERNNDLIVVGESGPQGEPIELDDLVVALRSILKHGRTPLVSMDPPPGGGDATETSELRRLMVRFEGGIQNTKFGQSLLEADVVLKKLGLGMLSAEIWGVRSYFAMSADQWRKTGRGQSVESRFWFRPRGDRSFVATRRAVAIVRELAIDVRTEVLGSAVRAEGGSETQLRDAIGEEFASALAAHFPEIAAAFPELRKLDPLFRLTALAEAIRRWEAEEGLRLKGMDYWLYAYPVSRVATPETFSELSNQATRDAGGETLRMTVSGGVELSALVKDVRNGVITAFRELVIKSRPRPDALLWEVPLGDALRSWSSGEEPEGVPESQELVGPATPGMTLRTTYQAPGAQPVNWRWEPAKTSARAPSEGRGTFTFESQVVPRRDSTGVGGVMLSGMASIAGGEVRPALTDGGFALVVDGDNARLEPRVFRKFVTALWAVYFSRQDPGISIDPIYVDPETGSFSDKHIVRYIGRVVNTDLGRVMREADYQMKKWSVGTERADVPGFKSPEEIAGRSPVRYLNPSRFWLVPEDMRFKRVGNMLLFEGGRMRVNTEVLGSSLGETLAEPHNEAFARFFTERYEEIARKHPIYQELFEYAKLVALAKYLKESRVPLLWFLLANRDLVLTEDSPGTVDNLIKGSAYWQGLTIQGGVDLAAKGQYVYDAAAVKAINEAIQRAKGQLAYTSLGELKYQVPAVPFSFGFGKQSYSVVPQHYLSAGKDRYGNLYQTDLALQAEGFLVTDSLLAALRAELIRQHARRVLGPLIRNSSGPEFTAGVPELVRKALEKAVRAVEPLLRRLESLRNREFKTEEDCGRAWDEVAGSEAAEWKAFFVQQAHYVCRLELVRYFNPARRTGGEFGAGWRLLIPFRIKPADKGTLNFLNVLLPREMEVENLLSGRSERLIFSPDRYALAGYVPERPESSLWLGLFLLTDASFRLVDKIGNEFHFDPQGYLTDLWLSEDYRMHIEYTSELSQAFEQKPYSLEVAGPERLAFLNVLVPKSMVVLDRIHNQKEVLNFSAEGEIAGYVPARRERSKYRILALLSDGSFELVDNSGNLISFTPSGEFERLQRQPAERVPASISVGPYRIDFLYTTDRQGQPLIAGAQLRPEHKGGLPIYDVRYEYDEEGRLSRAERRAAQEAAIGRRLSPEIAGRAVGGSSLRR